MTLVSDQIREQGYCFVSPFTEQETDDIRAYLTSRQIYPGCHVVKGAGPPGPWEMHASADVVSWHMHDVLLAPHLIEKFLRHTADAGDFLGTEDPILYSVNAFCTRPVAHVRPDIQDWHRDTDDVKFVPMFVTLTPAVQRLRFNGEEKAIVAASGSAFFSDTMNEHYGEKPPSGDRIIVWARWGVTDPPASYVWDSLTPMDKSLLGDRYPTDPWLQRSMRLVAR
jgi:hypothetical protein